MMAVSDSDVVGIRTPNGECCLDCAVKRYGELRVERLRAGLEHHENRDRGPLLYYQWEADEDAEQWGYEGECGIGEAFPEWPCIDCGKRLDRVPLETER